MPTTRKLGKKPPKIDRRTLKLSKYLVKPPVPPVSIDWTPNIPNWPMDLNDRIGNCTIAASAHMIQEWTALANPPAVVPSNRDVLRAYEAVSGYIPSQPDTDQGATVLDVLSYWRKKGIGGRKILAYVSVQPKNKLEVQQAISLFGAVYSGVALPLAAQAQNDQGTIWCVPDGLGGPAAPNSWGGHAIPVMAYEPKSLKCITWGDTQKLTWYWLESYCDEAFCVLSQDWIDRQGLSPSHFNLSQLKADLAQL